MSCPNVKYSMDLDKLQYTIMDECDTREICCRLRGDIVVKILMESKIYSFLTQAEGLAAPWNEAKQCYVTTKQPEIYLHCHTSGPKR